MIRIRTLLTGVAVAALAACAPKGPAKLDLASKEQKVSYSIGLQMGKGLKEQGVDIQADAFVQGVKDANGGKPLLTDAQVREVLTALQGEIMSKGRAKDSAAAVDNEKAGEAFLAANKTKEGVKTTPSGLQYKVITPGSGPKPNAQSTVTVNYRGTSIEGKEFDKSPDGKPVTFSLTRVIPGWTEALQLMSVGSKYEFYIPGKLGYGEQGSPPAIGPNETLIFQVEMVAVK
ncbi:MAG: FKBP-type peptidyl-prolyl cis-trans isomerase [Gemmatimonadota bacterium]